MIEKSCPLGHSCDKCLWHTHLRGQNPQTGQEIDNHGCAIAFLPILMIENSQQQRQTSAAVESFRNEMSAGNGQMMMFWKNAIEDRRTN